MVVALVPQVGTPAEVDGRPAADAEECVQEGLSLLGVQAAALEEPLSREEGLVLGEESLSHRRLQPSFQAGAKDRPAGASRTEERGNEDAGVHDDDHPKMIAYVLSRGLMIG